MTHAMTWGLAVGIVFLVYVALLVPVVCIGWAIGTLYRPVQYPPVKRGKVARTTDITRTRQ